MNIRFSGSFDWRRIRFFQPRCQRGKVGMTSEAAEQAFSDIIADNDVKAFCSRNGRMPCVLSEEYVLIFE